MFCHNCGREIAEKSMFCTYCGAKLDNVTSVPIPSETPRSNLGEAAQRVSLPVQPAGEVTSGQAEAGEAQPAPEAPEQPQEAVKESAESSGDMEQPLREVQSAQEGQQEVPQENNSATAGWSAEVPLTQPEADEKPRKYYTGFHLAICLVITGIMAATAGVFAGLYFSVI